MLVYNIHATMHEQYRIISYRMEISSITHQYLLYASGSRGVVKRHNQFKTGINDPELLHCRSGKSKFIFASVQNPCLQPP